MAADPMVESEVRKEAHDLAISHFVARTCSNSCLGA